MVLSVKFTKLISSGAMLSALGYGADTADTAPGKGQQSTCNAGEKGVGEKTWIKFM